MLSAWRSHLFTLSLVAIGAHAATRVLRPVTDVPLPGSTSRFDYASLDAKSGRLYLSHMGASEVVVFDVRRRETVAVLKGFRRCTGILAVPALGRIFVSAAGSGEVVAVDAKTDKILARLPAPGFPDGIAYEPTARRLFVSEEAGRAVTAIDPARLKVLARIELGGEAGNTQVDSRARLVYTNDQTDGDLVVIDPATLAVRSRIALGIKGNHGLALDTAHHLAFIASEDEDLLLVLDLQTRKIVARFRVGHEPDVLAFDPGPRRLFVASESGPLFVFRERGGTLIKEAERRVGSNAHVVVVDPATHLIYVPLKDVNGRPVLRILR